MCLGVRLCSTLKASSKSAVHGDVLARRLQSLNFFSQNCLGLKTDSQRQQLVASLKQRRAYAASLQETWHDGSGIFQVNEFQLVLAGPDHQVGRGTKGIGIALSPEATKDWESAGSQQFVSSDLRSLGVRLASKDTRGRDVCVFFIAAYAPIGAADQLEWDAFFDGLDYVIARRKADDILIIGADANSSMGVRSAVLKESCAEGEPRLMNEPIGPFGNPYVNKSGKRFASFLGQRDMVAPSTFFQKKKHSTWMHPGTLKRHQIDHFLCFRKDFKRVRDCGRVSQLLSSDHAGMVLKLQVECRMEQRVDKPCTIASRDSSLLVGVRPPPVHKAGTLGRVGPAPLGAATKKKDEKVMNAKGEFCREVEFQRGASLFFEAFGLFPAEASLAYSEKSANDKLTVDIQLAAVSYLPEKVKPSPSWYEQGAEQLQPALQARNVAVDEHMANPSDKTRLRAKECRKKAAAQIGAAKSDYIIRECDIINQGRGDASWKTITRLKGALKKMAPVAQVKMKKPDGNGGWTTAESPAENAQMLGDSFAELLSRKEGVLDDEILDWIEQQPTMHDLDRDPDDDEIEKAVRRLNLSSPGKSKVSAAMVKALLEERETFELIKEYVHDFWVNEVPPESWLVGILKALPKKGDLGLPKNWRGITLGEVLYKVVATIMMSRLEVISAKLPHEGQVGFRPARGSRDGNFNVRQAYRKRHEHGLETWILFLDLVKAFDRVPRSFLWKVLERLGCPPKLLRLLKALHSDVTVEFTVQGVKMILESLIGVKQGDILGPILFVLFICGIMMSFRKKHPNSQACVFRTKQDFELRGRKFDHGGEGFLGPGECRNGVHAVKVDDSEYADDCAVMYPSDVELRYYTPLLFTHFSLFGMEIHKGPKDKVTDSKTEVGFFPGKDLYRSVDLGPLKADPPGKPVYIDKDGIEVDFSDIEVDAEHALPVVFKFCYLGSMVTADCTDTDDADARVRKANAAFGALNECLFSQTTITYKAKAIAYSALVLSILLYGSEAWAITQKDFQTLRVFHASCCRKMCRFKRPNHRRKHTTNADLRARLGLEEIEVYVYRRQLGWLGDVSRMPWDRVPRQLLSSWVSHKRPVGAPKFTYGKAVYAALSWAGITTDRATVSTGWPELAQDKGAWKEMLTHLAERHADGAKNAGAWSPLRAQARVFTCEANRQARLFTCCETSSSEGSFLVNDSHSDSSGTNNDSSDSSTDSEADAADSGGDSPQRVTWEPRRDCRRDRYETRSRAQSGS